VAINDTATTNEDTPITISAATLLANDTDIDGGTLRITSVQGATNGTVNLVGGNPVFAPAPNYSGPASFTYTISDSNGGSSTASVNVTVIAIADVPNLVVTNSGAQVFNTGWETAADADNTSQPNPGPALEGWNLVYPTGTTGGVPTTADTYGTNGVNRFETWTVGDQMSNQATNLITIAAATGDGRTFLELNNASSTTLPQTLGIERTVATQSDKIYELSLDYAGRLGYAATFTKIDVLVNGSSIGTYASTSPQTALDWQNLLFSFNGSGSDTIRIITDASTFDANGRGAMIDDINLRYTQGAIQGNAVGGTQTSIGLTPYITTSLIDTDGSEVLTVTLTGIPTGSVITTASSPTGITPVGGAVTISKADLAGAQILLPATHVGTLSLGVTATATESSNANAATKSATLTLEVLAKGVTVTDLIDTNVNTAPDAKKDAPTTVLIEAAATSTVTGQAITGGTGNVTDTDPNVGATLRVTGLLAGVGSIPTGETAIASPITAIGRYGSLQISANGSYTYTLDNTNTNTKALVTGQIAYDVFTYKIRDGQGGYDTATINVTVNGTSPAVVNLMAVQSLSSATNTPPVAVNDSASTTVNAPVTISASTLVSNDTDSNGDTLTITSVQGPTNGTVALVGGNLVFTPTADYIGPASFGYTISDGHGGTNSGSVNVTVNPVPQENTPPVAVTDSALTTANTSVTIAASSLLGNDADANGDILGITSVQNGANGTVALVSGNVVFTPTANYFGPASFSYTISDNRGGTSTANVNVTVSPTQPTNTSPAAVNDSASTTVNTQVTISASTLVSNDTDSNGDTLTITSVQGPTNGTVALVGGNVVFTPTANYTGPASFGYTISDGHGGTSSGSVNVTVNSVPLTNHAPVAAGDSAATTANTPIAVAVLSNDTDPDGDTLSISSLLDVTHGTAAIAGGNVVFTPAADYTGAASFNYTISDGHGGTNTANVGLTVSAVNHAPVAAEDSATTTENTSVTIAVLSNDTDPDGDSLSISSLLDVTHGTAAIAGGNIVFTPTADYTGAASFNYTISDGHGGTSTATVGLTVNAVNHAPVAAEDSATTTKNTSVTIAVLSNDTDPDGETLSISSVLDVTHGTVDISGGNVVFTPTKDYTGVASFSYAISDGHGGTASASVSITIAADLLKAGSGPV
jgi:VCBS repeat-containing protein